MNRLTPNEELLKQKLISAEMPFDASEWARMDRELSKKNLLRNIYKAASIITIITSVALLYYIFTNNYNHNNDSKINNLIVIDNTDKLNISTPIKESDDNEIALVDKQNIEETSYSDDNQKSIIYNNVLKNEVKPEKKEVVVKDEVKDNVLVSKINLPNPDFSFSVNSGCLPLEVNFYPYEKSDSMIYAWDFGDGNISTAKNPVHVYKKSGNYNVKLMVKYFRSEEIKTKVFENAITVYQIPEIDFDINVNDNNINLINKSNLDNTYVWNIGNTSLSSHNVLNMPLKNGKHNIELIATNKFGCVNLLKKNIEINVEMKFFMPNAFTPDGDGRNDEFGPVVEDNKQYSFHMVILNSRGQQVYEGVGSNINWNGIVQSTNQPAETGMYFWKIKASDSLGNTEHKSGNVSLIK